jgi:hypothetical protein
LHAGGQSVYKRLDTVLLQIIPGYAGIKGVTGGIRDEDAEEVLKPVLVRFDDQYQLAFEVDRATDGLVAVYMPGAPGPRSGTVSFVTSDRIRPVDVGFKAITKICKNLGRGSGAVLSSPVSWDFNWIDRIRVLRERAGIDFSTSWPTDQIHACQFSGKLMPSLV